MSGMGYNRPFPSPPTIHDCCYKKRHVYVIIVLVVSLKEYGTLLQCTPIRGVGCLYARKALVHSLESPEQRVRVVVLLTLTYNPCKLHSNLKQPFYFLCLKCYAPPPPRSPTHPKHPMGQRSAPQRYMYNLSSLVGLSCVLSNGFLS